MTELGEGQRSAYQLLQDLKAAKKTDTESVAEQRRNILREADISEEAKSAVYYTMMATEKERQLLDELADNEIGQTVTTLLDIKDAEQETGATASNMKRNAIISSGLDDAGKRLIYNYVFGNKQEDGTYLSGRDDDIEAFQNVGLSMDDFLTVQNMYAIIDEEEKPAGSKRTDFSRWLNEQNFKEKQIDTIKDCFEYRFSMVAEETKYEKLFDINPIPAPFNFYSFHRISSLSFENLSDNGANNRIYNNEQHNKNQIFHGYLLDYF